MERLTVNGSMGPDSSYYGGRGDWYIAYTKSRDSGALDLSNFDEMLDLLGDGEDVAIERMSHWAVGWIEHVLVRPDSDAYSVAADAERRLENYPALSDERMSEYEREAGRAYWEDSVSMSERVALLNTQGESVFAARASYAELYHRAEATYYSIIDLQRE